MKASASAGSLSASTGSASIVTRFMSRSIATTTPLPLYVPGLAGWTAGAWEKASIAASARARAVTLFRVDPGFLEALRPGAELPLGERAQLLGGRAGEGEALLVDLLADRRAGDDLVQLLAHARGDLRRHSRGAVHRGEELDVDRRHAGFDGRWHLGQERPALRQRHRERLQASALDVGEAAGRRGEDGVDLSAEDVGHRRRFALVGHAQHVDAGVLHDLRISELACAAVGREIDLPGILLRV